MRHSICGLLPTLALPSLNSSHIASAAEIGVIPFLPLPTFFALNYSSTTRLSCYSLVPFCLNIALCSSPPHSLADSASLDMPGKRKTIAFDAVDPSDPRAPWAYFRPFQPFTLIIAYFDRENVKNSKSSEVIPLVNTLRQSMVRPFFFLSLHTSLIANGTPDRLLQTLPRAFAGGQCLHLRVDPRHSQAG